MTPSRQHLKSVLAVLLIWITLLINGKNTPPRNNASPKMAPSTMANSSNYFSDITLVDFLHLKSRSDVLVMDARTPIQYADGHIAGAWNSDRFTSCDQSDTRYARTRTLIVYGNTRRQMDEFVASRPVDEKDRISYLRYPGKFSELVNISTQIKMKIGSEK